ncbi:MAG: cyanophycin synthetase, partial [Synergistaceae bacterium]|nr:cyanophycin synthetase [Synergistaceae bacterium]
KFKEIESRLQSLASPGIRPGLARLSCLLMLLGNPERKFKAVHIVGTNGKGSTASTLSSILKESGCKTALYTSPHLISFGERLALCGKDALPEKWEKSLEVIERHLNESEQLKSDPPTYFELITAAAFMIIAEEKVDIAVIEAGLGGRLDATNILSNVILTLVAPIGIDHSEYLGSSLSSVAKEKFAVMRPGIPAIFSGGEEEIESIFFETAYKKKTPAQVLRRLCSYGTVNVSLSGTDFYVQSECMCADYHTPLIGTHQTDNAALALAGACALKSCSDMLYADITFQSLYNGVAAVKWPGRLEIINKESPLLIVDGAHNPHALKRLAENTKIIYGGKNFNLILAMMKDKDISESLDIIKEMGATLFCTEIPDMQRSLPAQHLLNMAEEKNIQCAGIWENPMAAVKDCLASGNDTLCCGSLFLSGYIKEHSDDQKRI